VILSVRHDRFRFVNRHAEAVQTVLRGPDFCYNPNWYSKSDCRAKKCLGLFDGSRKCRMDGLRKKQTPTDDDCWRYSFFWHLKKHRDRKQSVMLRIKNGPYGKGQRIEAKMARMAGITVVEVEAEKNNTLFFCARACTRAGSTVTIVTSITVVIADYVSSVFPGCQSCVGLTEVQICYAMIGSIIVCLVLRTSQVPGSGRFGAVMGGLNGFLFGTNSFPLQTRIIIAVWILAGLHAWNSRIFFKQRKRWAKVLSSLDFVVDEPTTLGYYKWIHRFCLVPIWVVFKLMCGIGFCIIRADL